MREARQEVSRQRARLDATFERISAIDEDALEIRADFAKYLCVRVSGFLETSVATLLKGYAAAQSSPPVARYVAAELERFQNAKKDKLITLFGRFDDGWRENLETFLADQRGDAIGTIVANRHKIAHGENSDLSFVRVSEHWTTIKEVVAHLTDLLDPP
ncbi:MAG: HEPN domain-containing protein [Actinomycetota bacterium]|nr:HEPN domain-containing protein [Actinomycetota bacterium]MDQ5808014.1 HEPN domain-containing protein [Actinomycetota bacterium]